MGYSFQGWHSRGRVASLVSEMPPQNFTLHVIGIGCEEG